MEIISIPILQGELPKFLGAICYEGDKNVKRLEFTGAEPNLMYKLDMERTDGMKNVVDLANQNGTLVLEMDGSVYIPAGRYQVQLRTIGEVVRHSNKAFLTVRDAINAENAFGEVLPTEMAQMEVRMTDAMHRTEETAAKIAGAVESASGSAKTAAQSALGAKTSAEKAESAAKRAEKAADITPESIGAIPGYKGDITSGDLDDYTAPGNYRIVKSANTGIENTPFTGDTGTFLQVIPFSGSNTRLVQEAITNKSGGVDRKWRTKSVGDEGWSQWQDSCEVYIVTCDRSINTNKEKIQEAWGLLTWKFGKYDDGRLAGNKTVFCKYRETDPKTNEYEYYMLPLSKITPNYISFRGMTSDSTMRIVYFYNTSVSDSTKWGWSTKTQSMVTTTTTKNLQTQITNLEKRIAALEGGGSV